MTLTEVTQMPTDDERREVAERLRAYGKEFGDPTWRELCNVVFWDEDSYPTAVRKLHLIDRLADLIDPGDTSPSCRDTVACDREALLALAEECDEMRDDGCSIGSYEVYRIAHRIREALGVGK